MKHVPGIGVVCAVALLLRFRFHSDGGLTYWTSNVTRMVPYNVIASWILVATAFGWFLWLAATFAVSRLR